MTLAPWEGITEMQYRNIDVDLSPIEESLPPSYMSKRSSLLDNFLKEYPTLIIQSFEKEIESEDKCPPVQIQEYF